MLPNAHFATVYAKPAGRPMVDTFVTEVSQDTWIYFPWDMGLAYQAPIGEGSAGVGRASPAGEQGRELPAGACGLEGTRSTGMTVDRIEHSSPPGRVRLPRPRPSPAGADHEGASSRRGIRPLARTRASWAPSRPSSSAGAGADADAVSRSTSAPAPDRQPLRRPVGFDRAAEVERDAAPGKERAEAFGRGRAADRRAAALGPHQLEAFRRRRGRRSRRRPRAPTARRTSPHWSRTRGRRGRAPSPPSAPIAGSSPAMRMRSPASPRRAEQAGEEPVQGPGGGRPPRLPFGRPDVVVGAAERLDAGRGWSGRSPGARRCPAPTG